MICGAELAKEDLHRLRSLEGEPSVDAIIRELARQRAKKKTAKYASISRTIRITLGVRVAPGRKVIWCTIRREETVSTCQSDGVAQNGATYGISCTDMMSQLHRAEH